MTHPSGILDTSTVLRLAELDADDLPDESRITTVTLAELSVGPLVVDEPHERAARQAHLQFAESSFGEPMSFDAAAARAFGRVAADLRSRGRKPAARAFDALIAATAVAAGLPVYTFNPDDFQDITDLTVVPLP